MTFQHLNSLYVDLRDGLRAQVDPASMGDLNVRPPASDADEASFSRTTGWCYALFYEAGRTSIPFFLNLPGFSTEGIVKAHGSTLRVVHALRTFLSHNLGFSNEHDLGIRKAASHWFVESCDAVFPINDQQWKACCARLCGDAGAVLAHCSAILSACASAPERDIIFARLRLRIRRDWPAHIYDQLVADAAARMGESINARVLREQRLNHWRKFAEALADDADVEAEIERLIEKDVLEHFRARLPITSRELIVALSLLPGPDVRAALEIVRRAFDGGVTVRSELIEAVRTQLRQQPPV
jgi:hypothetical protein